MANENDPDTTTVSRERYEAVVRERDSLKETSEEAKNALISYQKRDAARDALKEKVEDPDSVADLIAPHLTDVDVADVADHIASDSFAPRLSAFKAATEPSTETTTSATAGDEGEGEGEEAGAQPASEPSTPFSGPSPGQDAGTQSLGQKQPLKVGSEEWNELVRENKTEVIEQAYKEDRVIGPSRPF